MNIKNLIILLAITNLPFFLLPDLYSQTEILKWKDGKSACVSITFDDGSGNQFEIAMPILDELEFPATFFINTGSINNSKYHPTFIGRPILDILRESETIPANQSNIFERTSVIRYLREIQGIPELSEYDMYRIGNNLEQEQYEEVYGTVNKICEILRNSNKVFEVEPFRMKGVPESTTWEDLKAYAEKGHEFACHTISHPQLSNLDEQNILYELEKCKEDIEYHLGHKHTLTVECPYGTHDERVLNIAAKVFPFMRNRCPENYIDEILRSNTRVPAKTDKEYIQWQRGPLSDTPYPVMTSWIDTSIQYDIWLVLVFHGIEGIGWEALPTETIQNYFNFIKDHEKDIWVATFQDAYKYIRERMSSKISESREKGIIKVELSGTPDKSLYDIPLTLKTKIPEDWKMVQIQQGNNSRVINPIITGGENFVIYDMTGDLSPVKISKAY